MAMKKLANTTSAAAIAAAVPDAHPPEAGLQPAGDLNGAVNAAKGKPDLKANAGEVDAAGQEQDDQQPGDIDAREIQEKGDFPDVGDARIDLDGPPLLNPREYSVLNHYTQPPPCAFRVQPRKDGKRYGVVMVDAPFGHKFDDGSFSKPLARGLLKQVQDECPNLAVRRYEARLIRQAHDEPFAFVLVPVDQRPQQKAENTRLSFLKVMEAAEKAPVLATKVGGLWVKNASPEPIPDEWPPQTLEQMADSTFQQKMATTMEPFRRFRLTRS
jgi:hypothetical protein